MSADQKRLRAALARRRRRRARRLVRRRARAAGDLSRARRLGDRGDLGPGRVQPRARDRRAAGGAGARGASARRGSRSPGSSIFGAASLVCGISGSIGLLLAARCVQAIGGAAAVCASLELLPSVVGSERRAATVWAASGALGAALGPGLGGLLTELISWQSIFFVQVPVAIFCGAVLAGPARLERSRERLAGPSSSRPGARIWPRTPRWRWSPRRSPRRSSSSSCC